MYSTHQYHTTLSISYPLMHVDSYDMKHVATKLDLGAINAAQEMPGLAA